MIYFVRARTTGNIKIGFSENEKTLKARLTSLQVGSGDHLDVLRVMPGDRGAEKALHERFAEWRLRGEWFRPNHDLHELVGFEERLELLEPAIADAWQRGYDAANRDVDAEVAKRVAIAEERVRDAWTRNQMDGRVWAKERRKAEDRIKRMAADHGIDFEEWRSMDVRRLVSRATSHEDHTGGDQIAA